MITEFSTGRRLCNSQPEVLRTIEIVWSAFRSVVCKEGRIAYVSMPITTGLKLYEICAAMGMTTADELKEKQPALFYGQILHANLDAGNALARVIAQREDRPIVAPSIFEARMQRWTQDEYMAMWLRMIEENVGCMYMSPGWEYSNGGAEEYLHAVLMAQGWRKRHDIDILDADGLGLTMDRGIEALAGALVRLHDLKLKAPAVANVFRTLCGLAFVENDLTLYDLLPISRNQAFLASADYRQINCTAASIAPLLREDYGLDLCGFSFNSGQSGPAHKTESVPENVVLQQVDEQPPPAQ